jgi:predicted transcriptional regulator
MFAEQLRRAVEASPRCELPKVSGLLWKAYAAGQVSEAQASELSEMIEARKALPAPQRPAQRRLGSRPRSDASMERRRRWAASGCLPPQIAARFTLAEQSVLAVVSAEVRRHAACTLTIGHIAALAGVCGQTVRNALRAAQQLGFAHVEQRRVSASRNRPNRVTIVSPEWTMWLRIARRGGASKSVEATPTQLKQDSSAPQNSQRLPKGREPHRALENHRRTKWHHSEPIHRRD